MPKGLREELNGLRDTVRFLQARVSMLEEQAEHVSVLREVTREDAKREVLDYYRQHPGRYPSDVALALSLDSALVRDLCLELTSEGLLEG